MHLSAFKEVLIYLKIADGDLLYSDRLPPAGEMKKEKPTDGSFALFS